MLAVKTLKLSVSVQFPYHMKLTTRSLRLRRHALGLIKVFLSAILGIETKFIRNLLFEYA